MSYSRQHHKLDVTSSMLFCVPLLCLSANGASAGDLLDGKLLDHPAKEIGDFGSQNTSAPLLKTVPDFSAIKKIFEADKSSDHQTRPDFADTSESAELRASWNDWNQRIDATISKRLSAMLSPSFPGVKVTVIASYSVTSDGRILDARITTKSSNPIFNAAVLVAVNSLNGNLALLQFPSGTSKSKVNKLFEFESHPLGDFEPRHHSDVPKN